MVQPNWPFPISDERFIAAADRQSQMKRAGAIATGSTILVAQKTAAARGQIKTSLNRSAWPCIISATQPRTQVDSPAAPQALNELPQPHVDLTFGLLNLKPDPSMDST